MRPSTWTAAAALAGTAAAGVVIAVPASAHTRAHTARSYANCTQLHGRYPHGVGRTGAHDTVRPGAHPVTTFFRSNTVYAANRTLDRDHDGIACEHR